MGTLSFAAARRAVLDRVAIPGAIATESVWLTDAMGRVCAEDIGSDRDMPPLPRSLRDGFAVRSSDLPGRLTVAGEIRAGQMPTETLVAGTAVSIMTGAVIPDGADQVVMKEHVTRAADRVETSRPGVAGEWISAAGSMAQCGEVVLPHGTRIGAGAIAMLASVGRTQVSVLRQPVVRILATGDEVVEIARQPNATEVRNSNSWALAADVKRFGGRPEILPIAPDDETVTRDLIEYGLKADLLLISGGVSAGDYDFVESALSQLGAEFYFTEVAIQPGKPTVFGKARGTYFFGLPGNPLSTLVTFRVFAEAALARLCGVAEPDFQLSRAALRSPYRHRPGLTRFLPGKLSNEGRSVEVLPWQGSGDIPALVRANCLVVVDSEQEEWAAGDSIEVIPA
ncbi:gephyrin-like molybdotransferase Glp [Bryobacter aggregatus]|uniref:molybdopterin molybdotransferase MoeA n=1 Tax=Bryobacter aggregatus TaxID=360054 RepID=UPI0004E19264|nr:gephyrin-like molybdotransferase Glp [Bryobacter aggregatus]